MNLPDLTHNAIATMLAAGSSTAKPGYAPVLQVLSVKKVAGDKYRAILSDGEYHVVGMVATQLTKLVQDGLIENNCVLTVRDYMKNYVAGKNVVIILQVNVHGTADARLGQPTDIEQAPPGVLQKDNNNSNNNNAAAPMYNNSAPPVTTSVTPPSYPSNNNNNPYGNSGSSVRNPYSPSKNRSQQAPIVHRGTSGSPNSSPITLISQLNMYQNRWTIKCRVVSKSDIRTWSNAKGDGTLFSVELLDSSGMDIRATMFKEAVEKFYNLLEEGKVYTISGGKIKVANIQYNTCKSQYELTLDLNTEIHMVDDQGEIQDLSLDLTKIGDLEQVQAGKNVDVIGIVQEIGDVQSITSKKTGQELQKAELTLVDDTGVQVRLTMWGTSAVNAQKDISPHQVVAFRRTRVSDYGGVTLSGSQGMYVEPKLPETEALHEWWRSQGSKRSGPVKSLSSSGGGGGKMDSFADRKTIGDIKGLNMGYGDEKGDYLTFKAHFTFFKKDKDGGAWYTACPNKDEPCRNRCKVTQTTDGNWQCDRCHGTYPTCTRKWIFSATVGDDTGSTWVSVFDEQAMVLMNGVTADEAFEKYENTDQYESYFAGALHTEWILKCRVKNEIVNDEPRLKTQVVKMEPVDYVSECQNMLAFLNVQ